MHHFGIRGEVRHTYGSLGAAVSGRFDGYC